MSNLHQPVIDFNPDLSAQAQASAVMIATSVSLVYAYVTQLYFIPTATDPSRPFWALVAITGILYVVMKSQGEAPELGKIIGLDRPQQTPSPKRVSWVWTVQLFLFSGLCIAVLSWFTTYTGGSLRSPYSPALLALALLSPQVAKRARTVLAVSATVLIAFALAGQWGSKAYQDIAVPDGLIYVTTVVTALTGLFTPVLVKWRAEVRAGIPSAAAADQS